MYTKQRARAGQTSCWPCVGIQASICHWNNKDLVQCKNPQLGPMVLPTGLGPHCQGRKGRGTQPTKLSGFSQGAKVQWQLRWTGFYFTRNEKNMKVANTKLKAMDNQGLIHASIQSCAAMTFGPRGDEAVGKGGGSEGKEGMPKVSSGKFPNQGFKAK